VNNLDLAAAAARGIVVTNAVGANAAAVADFVFCLALSLSRRLLRAVSNVKEGRWELTTGSDLWKKTLGVVGTGHIGSHVIHRAQGFDMKVLANDIVEKASLVERYGVSYVELETILRESDFLTLHVPRIPETEGLIGEPQLKSMKASAFLINTSRGGIVDEGALYRALKEGWIAGAALDVFFEEPTFNSPLFELDNFIPSPHAASSTREAMMNVDRNCLENVLRFLDGKEPLTPLKI
jgi:D-3-phosphoglycerate dehydrogenase